MMETQLLREISAKSDSDLSLVQIKISDALPVDFSFTGKQGWLRYQSRLSCAEALEPLKDQGELMAGEWIDGTQTTTRISLNDNAPMMRVTHEKALAENARPNDGWKPVLKQTVTVMARDFAIAIGGNTLRYAIYFGFRDESDAEEGVIRRLTDRFIGVSNGEEQ